MPQPFDSYSDAVSCHACFHISAGEDDKAKEIVATWTLARKDIACFLRVASTQDSGLTASEFAAAMRFKASRNDLLIPSDIFTLSLAKFSTSVVTKAVLVPFAEPLSVCVVYRHA